MARHSPPVTRQIQRVSVLQSQPVPQTLAIAPRADPTDLKPSKASLKKKSKPPGGKRGLGGEPKLSWTVKFDAEMREATRDIFGSLENRAWVWFFKMRIRLYNQRKKLPAGNLVEQLFARYTAEEVNRQHKVYLEAQQRVRQERIVGMQRQGLINQARMAEVESEDDAG